MVKETYVAKKTLEERDCAKIVNLNREYTEEEITFIKNGKRFDGHSLFNIINLKPKKGETIEIEIDGPKEEKLLKKNIELLNNL